MIMESFTASLHAGLIQRARPPKVVPLRESGAGAGRAPVLSLRASDVVRARPAPVPSPAAAPAPLGKAEFRVPSPASGRAMPQVEIAAPATPAASRRFGLTVRVDGELRERLHQMRVQTDRTAQSILHDALVDHLCALERARTRC